MLLFQMNLAYKIKTNRYKFSFISHCNVQLKFWILTFEHDNNNKRTHIWRGHSQNRGQQTTLDATDVHLDVEKCHLKAKLYKVRAKLQ